MAASIQVLLWLICMFLVQGHFLDPAKQHFDHLHPDHHDLPNKDHEQNRPTNSDTYSYNHHSYNQYYQDSDYRPGLDGMYPYFEYPGPFGMGNFRHLPGMPFGLPGIHNEYNRPSQDSANDFRNDDNRGAERKPDSGEGNSDEGNHYDSKEKSEDNSKSGINQNSGESKLPFGNHKFEDIPPKTNKLKNDTPSDNKAEKNGKISLNANKDYLLVGNNGNGVYLLHKNNPNTNGVMIPNNNLPIGNNVQYVPYNPQQPANQVYQVVYAQPPQFSNVPLTANRLNSNFNNLAQSNPSLNNGNSAYILVYANGQLIQIPGVVINSKQNMPNQNGNPGSNIVVPNAVTYPYQPNQGNNPMVMQVPNAASPSNNYPQPASNTNVNTGNIGPYGAASAAVLPPIYVTQGLSPNLVYSQPSQPLVALPNNMANGVQPNGVQNNGNQGPVNNRPNSNLAQPINNPATSIQPAVYMSLNPNNYANSQPTQEKEPSAVVSTSNNVPPPKGQQQNLQPVTQPAELNNNALNLSDILGVKPAVMVSGFKETNGDNKDKEKKDKKEKNKKKDKKKK